MELKWIEDFLSLVETRNFSRSAKARHVTQPAFSRRIRALEAWLGADLIDRTAYPTSLTPAGEAFKQHAIEMVKQSYNVRNLVRSKLPVSDATLQFALPHTLSLTFFPAWLKEVQADFEGFSTRLLSGNVHDAVMALTENNCDLLLCYYHPRFPVELDPSHYEALHLGKELVRPYAHCTAGSKPAYFLPGTPDKPVPFLAYSPSAYLRRITDLIIENAPQACYLNKQYETDMAEGLRVMALQNYGAAFLPASVVSNDVHHGRLAPASADGWEMELEIRCYRDVHNKKPLLERLWAHLMKKSKQVQ